MPKPLHPAGHPRLVYLIDLPAIPESIRRIEGETSTESVAQNGSTEKNRKLFQDFVEYRDGDGFQPSTVPCDQIDGTRLIASHHSRRPRAGSQ
jgi:hypothetical protein